MQEMVDQVHDYMWQFCQKAQLDIDPVQLKRSIGRQLSGALLVVSPESLKRIGPTRLAVMIDVANRYEVTLAEVLNEAIQTGADNTATLCRDVRSRKEGTKRIKAKSRLRVVK